MRQHDSSEKTLLLTGFEPFGDDPSGLGLNPSEQIARALHGQQLGSWRICSTTLPCEYKASALALRRALKKHRPQAVICLGQAGGRSAISIERIAVNWDETLMPDNAGITRWALPIVKSAPAAYFSTLPIQALKEAIFAKGVPAEISSSAGHFVCNHVFFHLMHALKKQKRKIPAGFVHVPYLPEQALAGQASMALPEMIRGITALIENL